MDFQLMERNLKAIIHQIDCSLEEEPLAIDNASEDPVDPFRKKMFEKKMRRSSVASDYGDADKKEDKLRLSNYCRPVKEADNS